MILKILGIIDIFIALVFWIYGIFNLKIMTGFVFVLGVYLVIKGLIFLTHLSIASILDIVAAFIIISSSSYSVAMPNYVIIIVSLFLIQKGIFSILS